MGEACPSLPSGRSKGRGQGDQRKGAKDKEGVWLRKEVNREWEERDYSLAGEMRKGWLNGGFPPT